MQNPFSERCFRLIHSAGVDSEWITILHRVLVEGELEDAKLRSALRVYFHDLPENERGVNQLKQLVISLLLFRLNRPIDLGFKEEIQAYLSLIEKHPTLFDQTLAYSYMTLIEALLETEEKAYHLPMMPSGFVTEGMKEISIFGDQIQFYHQIEIALNWLLIGMIRQNYQLIQEAGQLIAAFSHCLDQEIELIPSIWSSSIPQFHHQFFPYLFCTIYAFNQFAKSPSLENTLKIQEQMIRNESDEKLKEMGDYPMILTFFVDQILNQNLHEVLHEVEFSLIKKNLLEDVGLVVDRVGRFSTYLTLSGINQSLGSIISEDVQVLAMGPHFFPLGDLSKFGIFQSLDKDRLIPVTFEKKEDRSFVKGMTKLIHAESEQSDLKPSDTWLQLEMTHEATKLKFSVSLLGEPCRLPLAYVFFIRSEDTEMIGNKKIRKGSLDKYVGPAQKIVFKGKNKNFHVLPCFEEKMHLIPLQGKTHFWGADYLLACEISEFQKKYSWEFH